MVPNSVRVPSSSEFVFPSYALLLGVDAMVDFERRGQGDDQARDKASGERLWVATVVDLDPDATKFGRSAEVKVKIAAPYQPVPPASQFPGIGPVVAFEDVTLTPYVDSRRCKAPKCGARMSYSVRASGLVLASAG